MTSSPDSTLSRRSGSIVAFGGNALSSRPAEDGIEDQFEQAQLAMESLLPLLQNREEPLYVVHGNGPQVGQELLRQDESARHLPGNPLDACVAATQGWMGYILENTIRAILRDENIDREVATLLSQVEVDPMDPAFLNPTKPIGPFYTRFRARQLTREKGWVLQEDSGRGYRMVVPSPQPKSVLGIDGAQVLSRLGYVVIVGGGGGVPVARSPLGRLTGVEAVIDKDFTAQLIGEKVGAERFILVTDVPEVRIDFGTPNEKPLRNVTVEEMIAYEREGHFPPGSMGPKIRAAIAFLRSGGTDVLITSPPCIGDALIGKSGTRISGA